MRPLCNRNFLAFLLLVVLVSTPVFSRPIVEIVTPGGVVSAVDLGNGRWGVPAGFVGTQSNPIPLQDTNAVALWIGDTINPGFSTGSAQVNGLAPQTTFNTGSTLIGQLDVFCVGCNGPRPSITILNWQSLPLNLARSMVARVSLGVDATLPYPPYNAGNSVLVEIWFARTGAAVNGPPTAGAGPNQSVQFNQTVTLQGSVFDPDGDSTSVLWTLVGGTGGSGGIQLNGANSLTATFIAPSDPKILTFRFCADDGLNGPVCDDTIITVVAPGGGGGGGGSGGGGGGGGEGGTDPDPIVLDCGVAGNQPAQGAIADGAPRTVGTGELVTLTGSGFDPDNSTNQFGITGIFYQWTVTDAAGLPITLQTSTSTASFVAPDVTASTTVIISLVISDPLGCGVRDDIHITIQAVYGPLTVDAGPDQTVAQGATVTLTGQASDPDQDPATLLTYGWAQLSGASVALSSSNTAATTFETPDLSQGGEDVVLVFELTVSDGSEVAKDQVAITVTTNTAPSIDPIADQNGVSGGTLTLSGSAVDFDGDSPLYYLWTQVAGPAVAFDKTDQITTTITLPTIEENTAVFIKFEVHDGIAGSEVTFKISVEVVLLNSVILPAALGTQHPSFQGSYVSAALVSLGSSSNQITLSGRDLDGNETSNVSLVPPLEPQGQDAFLTQDILGQGADAVSIVAQGQQGPIQGFFMVGTHDSKNLDGIGGTLHESNQLYFPLARQKGTTEATLLFILNVKEEGDPAVRIRLFDQSGTLLRETTLPIAAFGSIVGTLDEIYNDPGLECEECFVEVTTNVVPVSGFLFYSQQQNFSSMTAQLGINTRLLLVPHLFADAGDGDTEIRILNTGFNKATVEIMAYDDLSNELGAASFEIEPMELFVASAKTLLNLQPVGLMSGHLKVHASGGTVGIVEQAATLVGVVSFTGNNSKFRSTLPMIKDGQKETLLLQVAQSVEWRMFTGLSILVPGNNPAVVTIQAYSEDGELTAQRTVTIAAGNRLVQLLDDAQLFGFGFEQVKGHLKIVSDEPVLVFALFGDYLSEFLAAIEGQAPIN